MAGSAILSIKILADASAAKRGLDQSASSMDKFRSGISKAAVPAALVGAAILKFGSDAVASASRTQQAMGGVDAVFGRNAATVKKWADDAAGSIGLAKSEYGELATLIGSQLSNAGLPLDVVTKKTGALIQQGADLAAMFGGTTADAVAALSSAMKGEFDPLERYGTSLSAAKISAELAATGADKLTGKAAAQAKTLATLKLITEQTAKAHGAAARESDTQAARAQQLAATVENLKSELGTALLPIVAAVSAQLAVFAKWAARNATLVQIVVGVIAILAGVILTLAAAMKVVTIVTWAMNSAFLANPVVLIVLAIVALIAVLVILYRKVPAVRKAFDAAFAAIKVAIGAVIRAVVAVANGIKTAGRSIQTAWTAVGRAIKAAWSAVAGAVAGTWAKMTGRVKTGATNLKSAVVAVWHAIRDAVGAVVTAIGSKFAGAIATAKGAIKGLGKLLSAPFDTAKTAIDAVKTAIDHVISAVGSLIGALGRIKVPKISLPHLPGQNAAAAAVPARGPALRGARAGTAATSSGAGAAPVVVNVYGALDPEGVARTVQSVLTGHGRRVGRRVA